MKKHSKRFAILGFVLFAFSLLALPTAFAQQTTTPTAQEIAMSFINNVLPIDLSQYQVTLKSQSTLKLPDGVGVDTVLYTLSSKDSSIDLSFNIENNAIRYCQVGGEIISDKQYIDILDATTNFLERYQDYSKLDSANLLPMLDEVDLTQNITKTTGEVKLTITNFFWAGNDLTKIRWTNTINGAEYTTLEVTFQKDGVFKSFRDTRAVYTIGDTSINVSREQAIAIALKSLSTYSYEMPDESIVSGFNVTEDKIVATLATSTQNLVLRPYWDIRMPLNQTYPGSVQGITALVWANTGEIIEYSNMAFGAVDNSNASQASPSPDVASSALSTTSATLNPSEVNSSIEPGTENASSPQDLFFVAAIAAVIIVLTIISVAVLKRRAN